VTSAPLRCTERSLPRGRLFGTRFIGLGSSTRPPACPELPTLLFHDPPLAPRSQARLHGRSAHEAASDPRPCPELRRVPRPSIEGTAAAQAPVLVPPRTSRKPRWIAHAATTSGLSAHSASLTTCRAGQVPAPHPTPHLARYAQRTTIRPKLRASPSPRPRKSQSMNIVPKRSQ